MQLASCYKIFIVNDPAQAMVCTDRLKIFHPQLDVGIFPDFGESVLKVMRGVQDGDLLWFNFYYFDEMVVALPGAGMNPILGAYFVVDPSRDGIALDVLLISKTTHNVTDQVFAHPYSTVISVFYNGSEIKSNPWNCVDQLAARIELMDSLKSILPTTRAYPSFDELAESCFKKLLHYLKAKSGVLRLWQKSTAKSIFSKEFGEESLNQLIRQIPQSQRLMIRDVSRNSGTLLAQEIKCLGIKTSISAGIQSKFTDGYFLINTDQAELDQKQMSLLEVFRTQITHFLDNTLYFQDLLKVIDQDASLMAPQEMGVMIVDNQRRVVDIDNVTEELTGWQKREAVGRQCRDLWQSRDFFGNPLCNTSRCPMQKALHQGQSILGKEIRTVKKSGIRRFTAGDYHLDYDNKGQISHGVIFVKDVTNRINLQERFYRLEQMARLGNFASELAHEIRNPVTGISSSAQYLFESQDLNEKHKRIVEDILMGTEMLEGTVKKYLSMARPSEPDLQRSQLNNIIKDVVKIIAYEMQRHDIILETEFAESLPDLYVDMQQMRQVYINIIMNAIEAMPTGGKILIKTYLDNRETTGTPPGANYLVTIIRDTGKGILPSDSGKVFDAFYTTKPGGSGLGLFTTQNILKKHDAEIQLVSEIDAGTEVIISFPPKSQDLETRI